MNGATTSINPSVDFGGGVTLQFPREATFPDGWKGKFNFLSIYGLMRIKGGVDQIDPYAMMQMGYNLFYGDADYQYDGVDLEGGFITAWVSAFSFTKID